MTANIQEEAEESQTTAHASLGIPIEKVTKDYGVQLDFDTGMKAWLQVLGAFFLWFNSW